MLPLKDRIVLKQFDAIEKTRSGIILSPIKSKEEKPNLGIVRFVGPEVRVVEPGNIVILGKKWFTEFKRGDEDLVIVNEPDIIGLADKEDLAIFKQKYDFPELNDAD